MQFFDLHCDTLYKAYTSNLTLNEPTFEISIDRGKAFSKWCECTAVWIPDGLSAKEGMKLFLGCCEKLEKEASEAQIDLSLVNEYSREHSFILTVENASFLDNDISKVSLLKDKGVRMITLTWNDENCLGGGADKQGVGLKPFGKQCLEAFEKNSIVIDVSHASDKLFYDVCEHTVRPFAASHSNSRKVCDHRRNITDEQFGIIKERGGVVGLNFHRDFLSIDSEKAGVCDVLRHTEHFLSLGGENTICIGSDFDGSDVPQSLNGIEKIADLYEEYLKIGYNEQLVQKILFDNAYNFFTKF